MHGQFGIRIHLESNKIQKGNSCFKESTGYRDMDSGDGIEKNKI
jgi:hypothetical protein